MSMPGSNAEDLPPTPSDRLNAQGIDELLTVDDVAALLKVSKGWVYEHIRSRSKPHSDQLPHIKVGKYIRFDQQALRRFIANKCQAT